MLLIKRKGLKKYLRKIVVTNLLIFSILFGIFIAANISANAAEIKDNNTSSDYAMDAIRKLAEKGIIDGDENGNFSPHSLTTRAQIVKILVTSLNINTNEIPKTPTFKDVPSSHWAYRYIEAAYKAGIAKGISSESFDPDSKCTREQMAKMFINSMNLTDTAGDFKYDTTSGIERFDDFENISNWAKNAVNIAVQTKLMNGTSSKTFDPEGYATKEQMAVVAYRFISKKIEIQDELDAVSMVQVSAGTGGFTFAFPKPFEKGLRIEKILDSEGYQLQGTFYPFIDISESYKKSLTVEGEYVRERIDYVPSEYKLEKNTLKIGKIYTIQFSFKFKGGSAKTIYCERKLKISENNNHVESVIPLNASQIRVRFHADATAESAKNLGNYVIKDEAGGSISVNNITTNNTGNIKYVILTLDKPVSNRSKFNVTVKDIKRFSDVKDFLPYSFDIIINDHTAPDIEQIKYSKDDKNYTSVTIMFNEPVKSGTVLIDNIPAGSANGEAAVISGLQLDGTKSHQVSVKDISDGVNTAKSSVITGMARFLEPIKKETIPPEITGISYIKDSKGRVSDLVLSISEALPAESGFPASTITAVDKDNKLVYAEIYGLDEDGKPILFDESGKPVVPAKIVCYTSKPVSNGDTKITFPIADGLDIYTGTYKFNFPAGLIWDREGNINKEVSKTVDFSNF